MNSLCPVPSVPETARNLPSVSVVMPCYNAQKFIGVAIKSVLDQDYGGMLEIIVVDDGSSDDSVALASAFPFVKIFRQANKGPAAARNHAIRQSQGDLIAFLDADDVWTPGSLQARVDILNIEPDVDIAFGDLTQWFAPELRQDSPPETVWALPKYLDPALSSGWLYPYILLDTILTIITALVRRRVFDDVGLFDEELRVGEDYDFWIRVAQDHRFRKADQVVARYRRHGASTTMALRNDICEYDVVIRAIDRFGLRSRGQAVLPSGALQHRLFKICFDHGYTHYWQGEASIAARSFRLALGHKTLNAKAMTYWLLSSLRVLRRSAVSNRPGARDLH